MFVFSEGFGCLCCNGELKLIVDSWNILGFVITGCCVVVMVGCLCCCNGELKSIVDSQIILQSQIILGSDVHGRPCTSDPGIF